MHRMTRESYSSSSASSSKAGRAHGGGTPLYDTFEWQLTVRRIAQASGATASLLGSAATILAGVLIGWSSFFPAGLWVVAGAAAVVFAIRAAALVGISRSVQARIHGLSDTDAELINQAGESARAKLGQILPGAAIVGALIEAPFDVAKQALVDFIFDGVWTSQMWSWVFLIVMSLGIALVIGWGAGRHVMAAICH